MHPPILVSNNTPGVTNIYQTPVFLMSADKTIFQFLWEILPGDELWRYVMGRAKSSQFGQENVPGDVRHENTSSFSFPDSIS